MRPANQAGARCGSSGGASPTTAPRASVRTTRTWRWARKRRSRVRNSPATGASLEQLHGLVDQRLGDADRGGGLDRRGGARLDDDDRAGDQRRGGLDQHDDHHQARPHRRPDHRAGRDGGWRRRPRRLGSSSVGPPRRPRAWIVRADSGAEPDGKPPVRRIARPVGRWPGDADSGFAHAPRGLAIRHPIDGLAMRIPSPPARGLPQHVEEGAQGRRHPAPARMIQDEARKGRAPRIEDARASRPPRGPGRRGPRTRRRGRARRGRPGAAGPGRRRSAARRGRGRSPRRRGRSPTGPARRRESAGAGRHGRRGRRDGPARRGRRDRPAAATTAKRCGPPSGTATMSRATPRRSASRHRSRRARCRRGRRRTPPRPVRRDGGRGAGDQGHQHQPAGRAGRVDPQPPDRRPRECRRVLDPAGDLDQGRREPGQQGVPGLGRGDAAGGAVEQPHADPLLQPAQGVAQRRGRHPEFPAARRKLRWRATAAKAARSDRSGRLIDETSSPLHARSRSLSHRASVADPVRHRSRSFRMLRRDLGRTGSPSPSPASAAWACPILRPGRRGRVAPDPRRGPRPRLRLPRHRRHLGPRPQRGADRGVLRETGRRGRAVVATKFGIVRAPGRLCPHPRQQPGLRRGSLRRSLRRLGLDAVDLYYCHRRDPAVPVEDLVGAMARLVAAGKVRALGLSEVSPATLRAAHAVHPIAAVQSEYSLWSREPEAGMLDACRELGITFVAYSPLGRGFLTGSLDVAGLAADDFRAGNPRFRGEALARNRDLVAALAAFAQGRGLTPAQVAPGLARQPRPPRRADSRRPAGRAAGRERGRRRGRPVAGGGRRPRRPVPARRSRRRPPTARPGWRGSRRGRALAQPATKPYRPSPNDSLPQLDQARWHMRGQSGTRLAIAQRRGRPSPTVEDQAGIAFT